MGAHGDNAYTIYTRDIKMVQKFIENIIEYVYESPARIAFLTKKIEYEKNRDKK